MNKKYLKKIYISFVLLLFIQFSVLYFIGRSTIGKKMDEAYIYGQSIANSIQLTMENTLEASESLKYFYLQYGESCFKDFDSIGANIIADNPLIGSLYIAPNGVIKVAYPAEVNESTIGFEMLKDPEQGPRAQLAVDTGLITVAGPHELIEGGVGFIIRNPVFVDDEFIGFTIIILDWDKYVEKIQSNIPETSSSYKYAVWKDSFDETAITDEDGFIFRNTDLDIDNIVDIEFAVPNDTWHLNVEPADGWISFNDMKLPIGLSFIISSIIMILIVVIQNASEKTRLLQIEQAENKAKNQYMERLSDALEKAKRADAAKSNFLSRMSHDIRTPLNGIIGLLEINEKHFDDRKLVDENMKKMRIAANHLLSLISDVLELSKMEDEDVRLAHEPFDLNELGRDVLTITELRANEAGIEFILKDSDPYFYHPFVYGSPLHIRQIFINIFSNCIKYNVTNGKIYYGLKMLEADDKRVTYQVVISDTGIGMSQEFLEHIYEPFSQEHSDARSTYQGTGLGMVIVKKLLDKMNGTISIESTVGKGSEFIITLSFDLAEMENTKVTNDDCENYSLEGINVLVAEDNELNMEIVVMLLEDSGANVYQAFNGQEAYDMFINNPPKTYDIILMDLMMPSLDGISATKAIREFEREDAKQIPIVAMTANAFAEDAQNCMEAGMNAHLAKPINVELLVRTIYKMVKNN